MILHINESTVKPTLGCFPLLEVLTGCWERIGVDNGVTCIFLVVFRGPSFYKNLSNSNSEFLYANSEACGLIGKKKNLKVK